MNKFFLYARKSTDEPDRQILSIDAQIDELKEFAKQENLDIAQTFIEAKTAKQPGRPIFNEMLSQIEHGKADGILAWHPDRLARNSVDGGKIIYLIDIDKILSLKFPTFWFSPTPQGKFMLNIAFGQSKYYIDNLSENVKRGFRQKIRRGEYPGVPPTGYVNNLATHKIDKDPERFPLIKKFFEAYATGNYSLKDLQKIGLVSRSNKTLSVSNIQRLIRNPFYYGAFVFKNELHQGIHEPAISKKLFDKVQEIIEQKTRPKNKSQNIYPFRGLLKCGECGCGITSETQKGHNYYRCTKKKILCSQKYIREELLAEQISNILKKVSLSSAWAEYMLKKVENEKQTKAQAENGFVQNLKNEIRDCENKLEKLLDAHLDNTISKEEYSAKKQKILNQKIDNEQKLKDFEQNGNRWLELCENFVKEANQARFIALQENLFEKRDFLKKIGSNPLLQDKNVVVFPRKAWKILYDFSAEPRRGEAAKCVHSRKHGMRESNPRPRFWRPPLCHLTNPAC